MKWRNMGLILAIPLWLAAIGTAAASEIPAAATLAPQPPPQGEITRLWLARQREGVQASPQAQPLSGPVLEQIHERYRKSFAHPIPAHFESEHAGSRGASSR